jgi:hypothetical protein
MNTKKNLLTILITSILLLTLVSCGGNSAPVSNPPEEEQANNSADLPVEDNTMTEEEPVAEPTPEEVEPQPEEEPTAEPTEEQVESAATVSFSADVLPILESRCVNCHGGDRIEGDFLLRSYDELMAGGESGAVVIPGDVDSSYLAELLIEQKMPKRGPKLTPIQTETILNWITQGAQNN